MDNILINRGFLYFVLLICSLNLFSCKEKEKEIEYSLTEIKEPKIFCDDFENEMQNFWIKQLAHESRDSILKDPLNKNNTVLKVTNNLEDRVSGGIRSELLFFPKDSIGYKTKYSFRFLLPEEFFKKGEAKGWYIIHQWHDAPEPGFNWKTYKRKTQPPVHLLVEHNTNGEYFLYFKSGLETGSLNEIESIKWKEKLKPNKWYTFSCEILWGMYSAENFSYAKPKLDGKYFVNKFNTKDSTFTHKIVRRNMYNSIPNYFKFGLYRAGYEKYNRDIYFDDFYLESERVK